MIPALKSISIEVSSTCNLKCKMCIPHHQGAEKISNQPPFIDIGLFYDIAKQISPWTMVSPQFQGEPLMHPSFLTLCEFLNSRGILFSFNTNGMLMDEVVTRELSKMGSFNSVTFSLDGFRKETFESIRIGSSFDRIMSNIDYFLSYGNRPTSVNFVIMDENRIELYDFIYYWLLDREVLVTTAIVSDNSGMPVDLFWVPHFRDPCILESMIILTNGEVIPCCRDHKYEMIMGNVKENSLWEIWKGEKYDYLRNLQRRYLFNSNWIGGKICSSCCTWMCDSKKIQPRDTRIDRGVIRRQWPFWERYVKEGSW